MLQKQKVVLLAVLVLLIFGIGGVLYWLQVPSKEEIFVSSYREGRRLLLKGDERARYKFEEALGTAPTLREEAIAKVNLGVSYFASDPTKAVQTLKEVYANTAYHPEFRAGAIQHIVEHYSTTFDIDLIKNHVLTGGEPWESFFDKGGGELVTKRQASLALRNALEYATSIYPLFPSEYGIAYLYSAYETLENANREEGINQYVALVLDHIRKGDDAYRQQIENYRARGAEITASWGLFYKAFALTNLQRLGKYGDTETIERAYEAAIDGLEQVAVTRTAVSYRLYYTLFLSRLGTEAANMKITEQLGILYKKAQIETDVEQQKILIEILRDPRYNFLLQRVASRDPRLKKLLDALLAGETR